MILSVENITFGFKKNIIFDNANLKIDEQGIYGLVAPNGFGKTTLLQLIAGLYRVKSGDISVLNSKKGNAKKVSFVQDHTVLYPYLTGYDHLLYICKTHGIPRTLIYEHAEKLGMNAYIKDKVSTYSLGMKQRLLLTMGLIKQPKLLLLDEPLNGLDPTSTILIRERLKKEAAKGTTVLVSSHNLSEMDLITDNIFFIQNKKILKENMKNLRTEKLELTVNNKDLEKIKNIFEKNNYLFEVEGEKIVIPLEKYSTNIILQLLVQNQIFIDHIDTSNVGAEARYRSLFEEEF